MFAIGILSSYICKKLSVFIYGQSLRRGEIASNTTQQSQDGGARHSQFEEKVRSNMEFNVSYTN